MVFFRNRAKQVNGQGRAPVSKRQILANLHPMSLSEHENISSREC